MELVREALRDEAPRCRRGLFPSITSIPSVCVAIGEYSMVIHQWRVKDQNALGSRLHTEKLKCK